MGRFSCFYGHPHSHRQKKLSQPSFEAMIKMLQLGSQDRLSANSITTLDNMPMVESDRFNVNGGTEDVSLASRGCRSGEWICENYAESDKDSGNGKLRKSLSVGCELDERGRLAAENDLNYSIEQGFSCDESHDYEETIDLSARNNTKSPGTSLPDQDREAVLSPHLSSDMVNHDSTFSAGDHRCREKEDSDFTECAKNSGGKNALGPSNFAKCYSMPDLSSRSASSPELSPRVSLGPRNKSAEDLNLLAVKKDDFIAHGGNILETDETSKDDVKGEGETSLIENYDSFNYACSSKDWIVPDEMRINHDQGESSSAHWDHFPDHDFKNKFIEDWVHNLEDCSPVEENHDLAEFHDEENRGSTSNDAVGAAKLETRLNPSMEAAKRYISSLSAASSTAHLANYGLVTIPLLSAFVSLKVLNLSGNNIVRITAGALPRGLHMLNLSKNKISTIEGLRELARLRALDLSYNKISRIGHGLASCASLKELYLAGNKISEVEGLHRLLKLHVLDLRFNKIATSKCLGQLAANYNSLQAISLEGNPAQKNVGDEQLKKYLQGLLPQLAYYNRQHIKTSTLKDTSDRSVRLGISGHQFDRGIRSDHKSSSRRVSTIKRSSVSSVHGQKVPVTDSPKQSKGRHGLVPSGGTKTSHQRTHIDMSSQLQSLLAGNSMHKSRSVGNLSVL